MLAPHGRPAFSTSIQAGWAAALLETERWHTPDHGQVGFLLAHAVRSAGEIAPGGPHETGADARWR